jgi:phosphatidylglycerophosphate synthase
VTDDLECVVILADESANWRVGGLRQLDRLLLALNEYALFTGFQREVTALIFWKPDIPTGSRWVPNDSRFTRVRPRGFTDGPTGSRALVLSTHLFVARNGLGEFLRIVPPGVELPIEESSDGWHTLSEQWRAGSWRLEAESGWRILQQTRDIAAAELLLLRRTGKPQDGFVSRFINRPISRAITRRLLRFPIAPNAWTLGSLVVPLLSYLFLVRGNYVGFVTGAALFQLTSILDGCDGEIARAKYLESERGLRLDSFCDLTTNLLFVLFLSIGLFRQPSVSASLATVYLVEGIVAVTLLAGRAASYAAGLIARDTGRELDRRDGKAILDSSERLLGGMVTAFLVQSTKRDVVFFGFLLLAVAGCASWILHIVLAFSTITLFLRLKNAGLGQRRGGSPS